MKSDNRKQNLFLGMHDQVSADIIELMNVDSNCDTFVTRAAKNQLV